jgi:hypothetical protein
MILDDPQLIVSDPARKITINSISFAARGFLLISAFFAIVTATIEAIPFLDIPTMEELELAEADRREMERRAEVERRGGLGEFQDVFDVLVESDTRIMKRSAIRTAYQSGLGPLAIGMRMTLVTIAFGVLLRLFTRPRPGNVGQSERAFLYAVTAQLFWPVTCGSALVFSFDLQDRLRLALDWTALLLVPLVIWQWRNVWRLGRMLRQPLHVTHAKGPKTADRIVARRAVAAMMIGSLIAAVIIATAATMRADTVLGPI